MVSAISSTDDRRPSDIIPEKYVITFLVIPSLPVLHIQSVCSDLFFANLISYFVSICDIYMVIGSLYDLFIPRH